MRSCLEETETDSNFLLSLCLLGVPNLSNMSSSQKTRGPAVLVRMASPMSEDPRSIIPFFP